jgi:proteic killer suppression protein
LIQSFRDKGTADIYDGVDSGPARRVLPAHLHSVAGEKLDWLNAAASLRALDLPGLRLEPLKGRRRGQHSIRINNQFRICFRWTIRGPEEVEVVDYH